MRRRWPDRILRSFPGGQEEFLSLIHIYLVAYTMYVTTLLATIRRIIEFAEQFQRGMTGIERFSELMDASVDIFDEEGAVPLRDVHGSITFDRVSFEYPDDHNPVLSRCV